MSQIYLNEFFPDIKQIRLFDARPAMKNYEKCYINNIPPVDDLPRRGKRKTMSPRQLKVYRARTEKKKPFDDAGWFDKLVKASERLQQLMTVAGTPPYPGWDREFEPIIKTVCNLERPFSLNWISELIIKYQGYFTNSGKKSDRTNLWTRFVKDSEVLETLSEDVPYISSERIYFYLNESNKPNKPYTPDSIKLFLEFLCDSIRSSPIVYYSLCNFFQTGSKSFCYNDFCKNNSGATMNVFGEYRLKYNKLADVFPKIKQPFAHKVIPFLAVIYPDPIPLKKWDPYHLKMIIHLFNLYRTTNQSLRRLIVQFFMIMDNIHDFGKPRFPYNPKDVCGSSTCITETLIKALNAKLREINAKLDSFDSINNFGHGFEASLLWQLIDLPGDGPGDSYFRTVSNTNNLVKRMKEYSPQWTNDTIHLETKLIKALRNMGLVKTPLNTAMFDGFARSDPVKHGKTEFTEMQPFSIPLTYDAGQVTYSTPVNDEIPKELRRKFPDKYKSGGENKKRCITACSFPRADTVVNKKEIILIEDVKDHVAQLGDILKKIWGTERKPGFFFTLKSLGDFAQVMEAKERGIILITQDSLEFLNGVLIGAMVIKANRFGKGWVLSKPLYDKLRYNEQPQYRAKRAKK